MSFLCLLTQLFISLRMFNVYGRRLLSSFSKCELERKHAGIGEKIRKLEDFIAIAGHGQIEHELFDAIRDCRQDHGKLKEQLSEQGLTALLAKLRGAFAKKDELDASKRTLEECRNLLPQLFKFKDKIIKYGYSEQAQRQLGIFIIRDLELNNGSMNGDELRGKVSEAWKQKEQFIRQMNDQLLGDSKYKSLVSKFGGLVKCIGTLHGHVEESKRKELLAELQGYSFILYNSGVEDALRHLSNVEFKISTLQREKIEEEFQKMTKKESKQREELDENFSMERQSQRDEQIMEGHNIFQKELRKRWAKEDAKPEHEKDELKKQKAVEWQKMNDSLGDLIPQRIEPTEKMAEETEPKAKMTKEKKSKAIMIKVQEPKATMIKVTEPKVKMTKMKEPKATTIKVKEPKAKMRLVP